MSNAVADTEACLGNIERHNLSVIKPFGTPERVGQRRIWLISV